MAIRSAGLGLLLLVCTLLPPWALPQMSPSDYAALIEGPQRPDRQGFDSLSLAEIMERLNIPGVSIAVIHNYAVHWSRGYGMADVETGARVTPETLFQAASISKPVSAMAFLRAAGEGKVSLDEDANRYLKSWKIPVNEFTRDEPVTPRALLSHTSGTGDGFGFPGYDPAQPRPALVQILNGEKPSNVGPVFWERKPWTAFKYSGGGTAIIQLLLVDVLGKPFAQIMREYVLDPLGMSASTFEQPLPPDRDARAARAHLMGNRAAGAKWRVYPEQAAAGLWTTPGELALFAVEIQKAIRTDSGRVLTRALASEMVTSVGIGSYAVGFSIEKRGEGWYFMHGGGNWGFTCGLVAHVRKGYGVVVMTNSSSGAAVVRELESRVAAAYNWDSLDKPIPR